MIKISSIWKGYSLSLLSVKNAMHIVNNSYNNVPNYHNRHYISQNNIICTL